ncbi:MAG: FtsX-like permease family protein [Nocardioides sp.]|nr:FtsX-like permease family protein [Nocardioides sp.]
MTRLGTMLPTVLRGLRSRALLSAGSVLLTALALGSAVVGPIFQVAVTNSYLVTQLDDASNRLTGLSWDLEPSDGSDAAGAQAAASAAVSGIEGPFAPPQTTLLSSFADAYGGRWRTTARSGACDHLDIEGACPTKPGEALMLAGDLDFTGSRVGQTIEFGTLGKVRIVGTYRVPDASEEDFWFDLERFVSIPPHTNRTGTTPYLPAPLVTVPEAFDSLPARLWHVRVDRRLTVPADVTPELIEGAEGVAATLDSPPARVEGGRLRGNSINDLSAIVAETRAQQDTARASITPAVISLVLVALALLLRLLMAAADLRLPELALASLRGLSRRQMWSLGLSEPLALLLLAVPAGGALGVAMGLGLTRWWLAPGLPLPLPWEAAAAGLGVALAAAVVAVLAVGLVLRVSLSDQLTGVRRPRATSRTALIIQLVLVAAAVAVLVSKLSSGKPGDPDVTDLILPVLLAVVAGIAATRVTAGAATWWTRHRRSRSISSFVASRAISRRQEGTLIILPVTAAIAIGVFGAGVYQSAGAWRESVAATVAPADVLWTSALPLDQTVALTHRLDPDGQYLMAATTLGTQGPTFTVVDSPRLAQVVAWQDQWTPGTSAAQVADLISVQGKVPSARGTEIAVTADNQATTGDELGIRVRFGAPDGRTHDAYLGPFPPGESTQRGAIPSCAKGCRLEGVTIGAPAAQPVQMNGDVRISSFEMDGVPVSGAFDGAGWSISPDASYPDQVTGVAADDSRGLVVSVDSGDTPIIAQVATGAIPSALPVIRGAEAETETRGGASTSATTTFSVDPVLTSGSVPLLGPLGLLVDYSMITTDRTIYSQGAPVYVLARGDTPETIREGLSERGAFVSTTLAAQRAALDQTAYALALRLYAVVALLVLLMAMASLFVSTAVQLPARRRDAAALRVVGVPRRAVMSSVLREFVVVLGGTAVAGLAAGTLAQYVVLRTVTLGFVENLTTPALVAAIDGQRLAVLTALAAVLFGGVAIASAALTVRGARGATLRENAR